MQNARQRSILAGMGISLWIPKLARTCAITPALSTIWRDQAATGQQPVTAVAVTSILSSPVSAESIQAQAIAVPVVATVQPVLQAQPLPDNPPVIRQQSPSISPAPDTMSLAEQEEVPVQSSLRFSVQAVELPHWILLIDEQSLQHAAAKQLWANICAAFANPEPVRFNWPLADGMRWQHPQGAKAALNGFLFRMGMDKRIGLMGQLQDDIAPDRIERLPTLQELLEQPLKKRSLWSLLRQQ